ncbi:MAG: DMT family transporter [Oscillospiraceae bacterium]|nr:DMT family transporter [Oscillospiraceae bacterium]
MSRKTSANLLMTAGSVIWGAAFVVQSIGSRYLGPFAFGAIRFFIGALVLLPVIKIMNNKDGAAPKADASFGEYLKGGLVCGTALFAAAALQQQGIAMSGASSAGFVTSLYVVLVPVFGFLFLKKKLTANTVLAVAIATVGVYLLCVTSSLTISKGDLFTMFGAVVWAVQILLLESCSQRLDGLKFAFFEFMACAALGFIATAVFERPPLENIAAVVWPLLYCGVLSVGVGFTAQIICIKYTDPVVASLIMSTEAVFAALMGWLILKESMSARQLLGGALVFSGVILAQLPLKSKNGETAEAETG